MIYKHLLVAIDMSKDCHTVLQRAQAMAGCLQSRLTVVHVVEPMSMAFGGDVPMDLAALQQQQLEQAQERMASFAAAHPEIPAADWVVEFGAPHHEIHRIAKEMGCDLIVTGSHGRHGLSLLLGSTSNDLLHGATTDVLAVHLDK